MSEYTRDDLVDAAFQALPGTPEYRVLAGAVVDALIRKGALTAKATPPSPEYPSDCSRCGTSYAMCTAAIYADRGACCGRCKQTATHKQNQWEAAHGWKTEPDAVWR